MAERTDITPRSSFRVFDRFADEMDRVFEDFGFGRGLGRTSFSSPGAPGRQGLGETLRWAPQVEIHQQNHELVVRADLPGIKREDVNVDVTEETVTISGERKQEQQTERGGIYRTERSYGSFYRVVPLPEGAMTDQAKATFKDGVLEIRMPAPPEQVTRGRRLAIEESKPEAKR